MKTALITGAANGIGAAISSKLKSVGFAIVGIDISSPENITDFHRFYREDITNSQKMLDIFKELIHSFQDISLVNNAGITLPGQSHYKTEDWNRTLQVNLTAVFELSELFAGFVKSRQITKGGIVNIGSLSAHRSFPNNPAYIASKHGVIGLTKYYAEALGLHGIRVNSVSPGYIATNMTKNSQNSANRAKMIENHTFLRKWGSPDDVANAVSFLLSDDSKYISGTDLRVDAGWLSRGLFEFNER